MNSNICLPTLELENIIFYIYLDRYYLVLISLYVQAEVTQRLSNVKEAANKPIGLHSHEDLAKKLQVGITSLIFACT